MIQDLTSMEIPDTTRGREDQMQAQARRFSAMTGDGETPESQFKKLEEIAQSFESIMMNLLMKSMRQTIKKNPLFSGGQAEEIFTAQWDVRMMDNASNRKGGLGIAKKIVDHYKDRILGRPPVSAAKGLEGSQVDVRG